MAASRGHGGHAAIAVNLDTGTHVDSRGTTHKTHPGNKAKIGPDTQIFAAGHPALPFHHHARQATPVHKRMLRRGNPHPNDLMTKMIPGLPGGRSADLPPPAPEGMPLGLGAGGSPRGSIGVGPMLPAGRAG